MGAGQSQPAAEARPDSPTAAAKPWAVTDHSISGSWAFKMKESVQCLCEGGRGCTREDPACQRGTASPIQGLHSSWVGDKVLAMARPWQDNIVKHDILGAFRAANIGMVLNLCEVGEHAGCGPGLQPGCGFTYSPEAFMCAKVGFFNFSWRDMGVPTLDKMMDIVQVMHYVTTVEGRKVAVHCHAGLGRTGLAIACSLVFDGTASAADAITMVRQCRPGALQTRQQEVFVSIFEQYLAHLRCSFRVVDPAAPGPHLGRESYAVARLGQALNRHARQESWVPEAADGALEGGGSVGAGASGSAGGSAGAAVAAGVEAVEEGVGADQAQQSYVGCTSTQSRYTSVAAERAALAAIAALEQEQVPLAALAGKRHSRSTSAGTAGASPTAAAGAAAEAPFGEAAAAAPGHDEAAPAGQQHVVVPVMLPGAGGGTALTLETNVAAALGGADAGAPLHILRGASNVGELYSDGLTIIRAASRKDAAGGSKRGSVAGPAGADPAEPSAADLGLDRPLPWNEHFYIQPDAFNATAFIPQPPCSYTEALRRQKRLLHGVERRQTLRLHKMLKECAAALTAAAMEHGRPADGGGGGPAAAAAPPTFAQAMAACLQHRGRLGGGDGAHAGWQALPQGARFGLADAAALAGEVYQLKADINKGNYGGVPAASPAAVLFLLDDWFAGFRAAGGSNGGGSGAPALGGEALAAVREDAEAVAAGRSTAARADICPDLHADEQERRLVQLCGSLTGPEQELVLVLAALARHALTASLPPDAEVGGSDAAQEAVRQLCRHFVGWLLGTGRQGSGGGAGCEPQQSGGAADATAVALTTFLWFLVTDDDGYRCLLHAKQGVGLTRRPSNDSISGLIGSGLSLFSAPNSPASSRSRSPVSPRSHSPLGMRGGGGDGPAGAGEPGHPQHQQKSRFGQQATES